MSFPYFDIKFNSSTRFPFSEMVLSAEFPCYSALFPRFLRSGNNTEIAVIAKITQKFCGKNHFRKRKYSTKFHIKLRKPILNHGKHFSGFRKKLKNKNALEFDGEKDGVIIFYFY